MKIMRNIRWWGCAALCMAGALLMPGCEDASTDLTITVTPSAVEFTGPGVVVLTAGRPVVEGDRTEELMLPLEWKVFNRNLGGIMAAGGHQAVYEANGRRGQNTVMVRDQAGREGFVSITQR